MSIGSLLSEKLNRKKATLHERYVAALSKHCAHPEDAALEADALAAAEAAGISPTQVEEDIALLAKAAGLAVRAARAPILAKRRRAAVAKVEAAEDELQRVTKPLEDVINSAGFEAGSLEREEQAARAAIGELVGLVNGYPELLAGFRNSQVDGLIASQAKRVQALRLDHQLQPLRIARVEQAAAVAEVRSSIEPWRTSDLKNYPIPPEFQSAEKAVLAREEARLAEIVAEIKVIEDQIAALQ